MPSETISKQKKNEIFLALIHSENLGQNSVLSTIPCNNNSGSAELLRTKFYSWRQASEKFPKD